MPLPRIAPVDPPYAPEIQADFDKLMRGVPPLRLFRTLAHNPRVLQRVMAGTPDELRSTVRGGPDDPGWNADDRLVIRLADRLHDTGTVDDSLWAALSARFAPAQLLELLVLAGLYHGVSYVVNATRVQNEAFAPRFPA